jgi:hypothetical protein
MLTTGRKKVTPIAHRSPVAKVMSSVISPESAGNTKDQAERLIKRVGNDRAKPNAAAEKRKK